MSRTFTAGVLAGAIYLAGSSSFWEMAEPPNFAPNASVGFMRKETGKVGLNAIRQAAQRRSK